MLHSKNHKRPSGAKTHAFIRPIRITYSGQRSGSYDSVHGDRKRYGWLLAGIGAIRRYMQLPTNTGTDLFIGKRILRHTDPRL